MKTETVTIETAAGISTFELTYCTKTRPKDMAWKMTTLMLHGTKQPADCGLLMFSDNKKELLMYAQQEAEPKTTHNLNIKFSL